MILGDHLMSKANVAVVLFCGIGGVVAYKRYQEHKKQKAYLAHVRSSVAKMIKDVPGFNKPSR